MPVTVDRSAPYAPPSAVIEVVERYRVRGLPTPVTSEVLARIGVSGSLQPRTLQALLALDLIDEDGKPTTFLESIRLAPESEFKVKLKEWLDEAYAEIIKIADPAADEDIKVRDAFRTFSPVGQQDRMVTLFLQLYRWAGVRTDQPTTVRKDKQQSKLSKVSTKQTKREVSPDNHDGVQNNLLKSGVLHPALAGLLASLPSNGAGWSKAKRDAFVRSFEAVLDFVVPFSDFEEQI